MKKLTFAVAALMTASAFADTAVNATTNAAPRRKFDKAGYMARWYKRTGGKIMLPDSKQGKIVFVNTQSAADETWIYAVATNFAQALKIDVELTKGEFALPAPKIHGNATLYVIDDAKLPTVLHAPENRWTMINVAPLREGDGEKPQFFKARTIKELTRGFSLLAGTQTSNYPESLLSTIVKPSDLDTHIDARLPVDIPARFIPYLAGFGVKPAVYATYKKACEEGWAPQPTNDVQKAVWDQVHAIPQKPIKIEYNEKRDKGK